MTHIPDFPGFGEEVVSEDEFASYKILYYRIQTLYSDYDEFFTSKLDLKTKLVKLNNRECSICSVLYSQNDCEYMFLGRGENIDIFEPPTKIKKLIFTRRPVKTLIVLDDKTSIEISDLINKIIGPSLDFHRQISVDEVIDYCYKNSYFNTNKKLEELYTDDLHISIYDNLGDKRVFYKYDILEWNPDLLVEENINKTYNYSK